MLNIRCEAHKMQIFLQRLNPDIAASVIMMKPTDLTDADEAALLAEATTNLRKNKPLDDLKSSVDSFPLAVKLNEEQKASQASVQALQEVPTQPTPTYGAQQQET